MPGISNFIICRCVFCLDLCLECPDPLLRKFLRTAYGAADSHKTFARIRSCDPRNKATKQFSSILPTLNALWKPKRRGDPHARLHSGPHASANQCIVSATTLPQASTTLPSPRFPCDVIETSQSSHVENLCSKQVTPEDDSLLVFFSITRPPVRRFRIRINPRRGLWLGFGRLFSIRSARHLLLVILPPCYTNEIPRKHKNSATEGHERSFSLQRGVFRRQN